MPDRSRRFAVYGPEGDEPLVIDAQNWVFALGTALELMEREDWVSRLSCEVHADGTVVAEDQVTGARYLLHRIPFATSGASATPAAPQIDDLDASESPGPLVGTGSSS